MSTTKPGASYKATLDAKKLGKIKRIIKRTRAGEEMTKADAPSRSTGIRNVYKASHAALAEIEEVLRG